MANELPELRTMTIHKIADTSEGERQVRYMATGVNVDEEGNALIDPNTVRKILYNPANDRIEHEPWPLVGIEIVGDEPPQRCRLPISFVERGRREGWIAVTGENVAHQPGGPEDAPWTVTHTFIELDTITLKTVHGDLEYTVIHQPGVYEDENEPSGIRVDWLYEVMLGASNNG